MKCSSHLMFLFVFAVLPFMAQGTSYFGPNGQLNWAIPSSQGSYLVKGTFTVWNSTRVESGVIRMRHDGETDPKFVWEGRKPYRMVEDTNGDLYSCGLDRINKTLFISRNNATGKSLQTYQMPAYKQFELSPICDEIVLFKNWVVILVKDKYPDGDPYPYEDYDILLVEKELSSDAPLKKVALSLGEKEYVKRLGGNFNEYLYFETNRRRNMCLRRVDASGNVDSGFVPCKDETNFDPGPAQSVLFQGKPAIFFNWALYDETGSLLPVDMEIGSEEIGLPPISHPKETDFRMMRPILKENRQALLIEINKCISHNEPCGISEPLGVFELAFNDGSVSKPFGKKWLTEEKAGPWDRMFVSKDRPGTYRFFRYRTDHIYTPAVYGLTEAHGADPDLLLQQNLWSRARTDSAAPKTQAGALRAANFLFTEGFARTEAQIALRLDVDPQGQITLRDGLDSNAFLSDYELRYIGYEIAQPPLFPQGGGVTLYKDNLYSFDASGKFKSKKPVGEGMKYIFDILTSNDHTYGLLNYKDRIHVSPFDPASLSFGQKYNTGYSPSLSTKVLPAEEGNTLIAGAFPVCGDPGSCYYTWTSTLTKINLSTGKLDPKYKKWGYGSSSGSKPDTISVAVEDPINKGGVYAAGKYQGEPFFGRLQANGEPDPKYWFVGRLKEMPTAIVPLKSGELYLGGIKELDGKPVKLLSRLKADGSIDETFDLGAGFEKCSRNLHYIEPAVDAVYRLSEASDDILILGDFWSLNSVTSPYAVRINRKGEVVDLYSGKN